WDMKLAHEKYKDAEKLVVTVEAKIGMSDYIYGKNNYLSYSDTRRVFRFDAETKRLEAFHIYLHQKDKDVLIFEADKIEYDQPIDPAIFTLKLPDDVIWWKEPSKPSKLPDNEKYEKMTPKEAATAFLEACSKENWNEAQKFSPIFVNEFIWKPYAGLQVISIGEPFQSKDYGGWLVPYEIKFKHGAVLKANLEISNDNSAKRYVVDGGI
ncbi:MAG TPA: hypothetical protein VIH42_08990, partial [Thermoguttaceae bacterium]